MAQQSSDVLTITRYFDAPRELVFKAWKDEELYKKWMGPKDYTCPFASIDFRLGGKFLFCMRSPDGKEIWGTGVYKEIDEPRKIVATDSFANKEGKVVPASEYGMGKDFPMEMLARFNFEEAGGRTKFTLEHIGLPSGEMIELTRQGWNETFDKLDMMFSEIAAEKSR